MDLSQWGEAQNWKSRVQLEDYWIIPGERWERPELRKWLWALFVIVKTEKPPTCPSTEKMWYIPWNTIYHKKEWKNAVWSNINGARYYTKWNKSDRKRQIYNTTHMWNLIFLNDANELIYETETDLHILWTTLWLIKEKCGGEG